MNQLNKTLCLFALALLLCVFSGCSTTIESKPVAKPFNAPACGERVYNRGKPPVQFQKDLYEFIVKFKDDEVLVGVNTERLDAFTYLRNELNITEKSNMSYRAAALYELMRVSAAMESSWNWAEGRDKAASNYSWYTQEAGIFQTSPNSHVYYDGAYKRWHYLDTLMGMKPTQNNPDNKRWNAFMKDYANKEVIMQHHAFMVRHNYRHYGPIIRKSYVGANINKECIKQIEALLN